MSSSETVAASDDFNEKEEDIWEKISYTWVINSSILSATNTANHFVSPLFSNEAGDCKLQIESDFPPKSVSSDEGYVGVFLKAVLLPNDAVDVKFTLTVRDSGDHVIITRHCERCFTQEVDSWGFHKMVRLSKLSSWTRDKTLKIHAEVLIKAIHVKGSRVLPMGSYFSEIKFRESMNGLFESLQFTDVVFEVEEVELKAHKCVLFARSPVFAAMFTRDSIEKHSGVVKIVDFESDIFRRFLHFVYSGKVSIPSVDVAIALFRVAEKYDFPDLKLLCVKYMSFNLSSSNVGSILLLAETFYVKDLKQTVLNYMLENIKNFCDVELDVYRLLEKENPRLLTEFLVMSSKNFLEKNPS